MYNITDLRIRETVICVSPSVSTWDLTSTPFIAIAAGDIMKNPGTLLLLFDASDVWRCVVALEIKVREGALTCWGAALLLFSTGAWASAGGVFAGGCLRGTVVKGISALKHKKKKVNVVYKLILILIW
jgi:hypothetical protein